MKRKFTYFAMMFFLLTGMLTPVTRAQASSTLPAGPSESKGVSPAGMLNPDGSLNLSGNFNGALDLSGYSVEVDPVRGPVFGAEGSGQSAAATGDWAALGYGGGVLTDTVKGIAVFGTNVYVVGNFTDAGNIRAADYVAKWDGANWSALGSNNMGNGALPFSTYSIAVDGSGNVYVGGWFTYVANGAVADSTAAKIAKWDGSTWSGLGSNGTGGGSLNGDVYSIAVDGSGNVYAGGAFTDVNNGGTVIPEADYVAKWDGSNWSALGNNGVGVGALGGGVNVVATSGTDVYVGGSFTDAAGLPAADRVAKWNGANWSALGSNGAPGNGSLTSGWVNAITVSGTNVYVGGIFTDVNNNGTPLPTADYIAKWDGANWSALGSNGANGALNNSVYTILVNGTDVYAGGYITNVAGVGAADYLAKWDGTNWNALGNNGAGNGSIPNKSFPFVTALAMQGSSLLVGGGFQDVYDGGAPQLQADYLAQWNGTNWSALGSSANGALINGYTSSHVEAILVNGMDVYVGGYFSNISNHGVNIPEGDAIVKWDGSSANWSALGSNGAGDGAITGTVYELAMIGTDLYVGGGFNNAGGLAEADYIAKWNGTNWSALGNNGAGIGALPALGYVWGLAVNGTDLYVGGNFTNAAGIAEADYIAKWNGVNWSALGNNGAGIGALNGSVGDIVVDGSGNVYAGGSFTDAAGVATADKIAKWDGTAWSALGSNGAGDGALGNNVISLAVDGTNLYVGGYFTNASNIPEADYIAKWDGTNWSALGGADGNGSLNQSVQFIVVQGTDVFAGGWFQNVFNNSGVAMPAADYVARWDGTTWSALGSNGANNGSLSNVVYALGLSGTDLLVGGEFTNVNNNGIIIPEADYIAAYGIPVHVPITYTVTKLADTDDGVCDVADCSLREAISAAVDGDSIVFGAGLSGTITLGSELTIAKDISVLGTSGMSITVSGNDAFRIFNIQSGAVVQISYLKLNHGYVLDGNGGAILNHGSLNLSRVIVSNSRAESVNPNFGSGGGIYSASGANLTLINAAQITTNSATFSGGGIYAAVNSGSTFSMLNSKVDHNTAYQGSGGGLYLPNPGAAAAGTIIIDLSTFTDNNVAGGSGGGGIFIGASATLTRSDIANNSVSAFTGGGGGMKIYEGGGSDKPITVSVTNATISGNTSLGQGGGVDVSLQQAADVVMFNNVTIADNHRNVMPGPPAVNGGGGVFASGSKMPAFMNSIIAANTSAVAGVDCGGAINSLDYNLIQSTSNCTISGTTTHNVTGVSAQLGSLANRGGGTQTMGLLPASPAIDAGNNATCNSQDQRGNFRPVDGNGDAVAICDMGAFEASYPTFSDVARNHWAWQYVERVYSAGITSGCAANPLNYCPATPVTRAQMAIFLLRGIHGSTYTPPAATGTKFTDVSAGSFAAAWIEQLANEGITSGCGGGNFCPNAVVTRVQMAIFLVKAKHGSGFVPPAAVGLFTDVPAGSFGANYIEQLVADGVTSGCTASTYCPGTTVKRDSMAVFLVKNFSLP